MRGLLASCPHETFVIRPWTQWNNTHVEVASLKPLRLTHWVSDTPLHELTRPIVSSQNVRIAFFKKNGVEDARKSYTQSYTLWDIAFACVFD